NPDAPQFDLATAALVIAHVADAPLTAEAMDISPGEGELFTEKLASFTDADPNASAGDYTVTINWGDQKEPSKGTVSSEGKGGLALNGNHGYEDEGTSTVKITIKDGSAAAAVTKDVEVNDGQLKATNQNVQFIQGESATNVVATFTDEDPGGAPSDYGLPT